MLRRWGWGWPPSPNLWSEQREGTLSEANIRTVGTEPHAHFHLSTRRDSCAPGHSPVCPCLSWCRQAEAQDLGCGERGLSVKTESFTLGLAEGQGPPLCQQERLELFHGAGGSQVDGQERC